MARVTFRTVLRAVLVFIPRMAEEFRSQGNFVDLCPLAAGISQLLAIGESIPVRVLLAQGEGPAVFCSLEIESKRVARRTGNALLVTEGEAG